ncbi:MAG TPA: Hsp20/alpha crystallin family protein [Acidimicrobiales bacterium]|nr:Hsp20/alpha crystallin family protein [Acidimicrobiales bacterium]
MALPVRRQSSGDLPSTEPWSELQRLTSQLQSLIGRWDDLVPSVAGAFTPLADIEETDDAYLIELDLAGVKKDHVEVEVAGRRITVSGERTERQRVGILRRRTRSVGRFHYEVTLPGEVDEEAVEAGMDAGVLTVRVPKAARDRRRRIPVS